MSKITLKAIDAPFRQLRINKTIAEKHSIIMVITSYLNMAIEKLELKLL
jgi:hypothetical protein